MCWRGRDCAPRVSATWRGLAAFSAAAISADRGTARGPSSSRRARLWGAGLRQDCSQQQQHLLPVVQPGVRVAGRPHALPDHRQCTGTEAEGRCSWPSSSAMPVLRGALEVLRGSRRRRSLVHVTVDRAPSPSCVARHCSGRSGGAPGLRDLGELALDDRSRVLLEVVNDRLHPDPDASRGPGGVEVPKLKSRVPEASTILCTGVNVGWSMPHS